MTSKVVVSKIGINAELATDPNDFVFHSDYNTFKIIKEATKNIVLSASTSNQTFTEAHSQKFIPLVTAFAKESTKDQVFLPNSENVDSFLQTSGWDGTGVKFNYIGADINNVIFNFDNDNGATKNVAIRYFLLEKI